MAYTTQTSNSFSLVENEGTSASSQSTGFEPYLDFSSSPNIIDDQVTF